MSAAFLRGKPVLVFDVESIGLHGEGFAVGFVVVKDGKELEAGWFACDPRHAEGEASDREWVAKNVPAVSIESPDPFTVREKFWRKWSGWREQGAVLAADCAWPVEARFLARCVDTLLCERAFHGPYPLVEISSVLLAMGYEPLGIYGRLPEEEPGHNPLCDARQSARVLFEALEGRLEVL